MHFESMKVNQSASRKKANGSEYITAVGNSVADPDPGCGIRCLFDPWIRDTGSGIGFFRIPDPESRISDPGSQTHIFES
jgi:hypothetical protein